MKRGRPSKGKYNQRIVIGRDPETGKAVRQIVYADKKGDLVRAADKARAEFARKCRAYDTGTMFGPYAEAWIKREKGECEANTIMMYEWSLRRCGAIEFKDLDEIRRSDLQDLLNGMSPDCGKKTKLLLTGVFAAASADGLVTNNPATALKARKKKTDPEEDDEAARRAFKEAEREIIRTVDLQPMDRMFLSVLYYFGLRREEALALTPADFNFEKKTLHVRRALAFGAGGIHPYIKCTKTKVDRYVPLPDVIAGELILYMEGKKPDEFLFTRRSGEMMSKSGYDKMWRRIVKALEAEKGEEWPITAHMVRHDYCTRLAYLDLPGVSMQKRAKICGHSYAVFTKIYMHVDDEQEDMESFASKMC